MHGANYRVNLKYIYVLVMSYRFHNHLPRGEVGIYNNKIYRQAKNWG